MSADFWSIVRPIGNQPGEHMEDDFAPYERVEDVIGPDGTVWHRFDAGGRTVNVEAYRDRLQGLRTPESDVVGPGRAYVDAPFELIAPAADSIAMSPNYPAIVVLDRRFALPRGIPLLKGRALALIRDAELTRLREEWADISPVEAVDAIAPHLERHGNGRDDAESMVSLLTETLTSTPTGMCLLLAGCVVP